MARILVVDDDEAVRRTIRRILERHNYEVGEASTTAEARVRLGEATYELLLCDIGLPGESGIELVRSVATAFPQMGVVMVTAIDDPAVAQEALDLGVFGYLVKPFRANEVLINVAAGLRHRELELLRQSHVDELESKVLSRTASLRDAVRLLELTSEVARTAEQETVQRLVTALTLRSEETGGHIQRMSHYASMLASKIPSAPWSEAEIRVASMLHDVGKIGVPDSILLKPGPLDADEFDLIKRHPILGNSLLGGGGSRVLMLGARICLSHHERFDGEGYPYGLAGDAIPIEARIAAIADVFDAITTNRVYRDAMPDEAAFEVLVSERGRHFDPDLLDLFMASGDEIIKIRLTYAEPAPRWPR